MWCSVLFRRSPGGRTAPAHQKGDNTMPGGEDVSHLGACAKSEATPSGVPPAGTRPPGSGRGSNSTLTKMKSEHGPAPLPPAVSALLRLPPLLALPPPSSLPSPPQSPISWRERPPPPPPARETDHFGTKMVGFCLPCLRGSFPFSRVFDGSPRCRCGCWRCRQSQGDAFARQGQRYHIHLGRKRVAWAGGVSTE